LVSQQETVLLALGAEIIGLAGKAVLEIIGEIEDELDVVIEIDHRGEIRHRQETDHVLARAVEMLIKTIERDGEDRSGLPFEGHARSSIVPHRRRAAAG
jgi:hypothetical protein